MQRNHVPKVAGPVPESGAPIWDPFGRKTLRGTLRRNTEKINAMCLLFSGAWTQLAPQMEHKEAQ